MVIHAHVTEDPRSALRRAGRFLEDDPIRHNLILTLLHRRIATNVPGRYVVASESGAVVGVVMQSPLTFIATITPMDDRVAEACVGALDVDGGALPGVSGEAASAARFAGLWTERTNCGAVPVQGQRIYEAGTIVEPSGVSGTLRRAVGTDHPQLVGWLTEFQEDAGVERADDLDDSVSRRVAAGQFWVWADSQPVSMAALTAPVGSVSRVQAVYTPAPHRRRGYAAACVARISSLATESGIRCMLYTDLGNPVPNSVYRRIGYRAVAEVLRYDFR